MLAKDFPEMNPVSSYLENTPWNTAHGFSESQNRERGSKARNSDNTGHPAHEEHHGSSCSESILAPQIENETSELAYVRRVRESRLPSRSDEFLAGSGIDFAESLLKLGLAVERCDLDVIVSFLVQLYHGNSRSLTITRS